MFDKSIYLRAIEHGKDANKIVEGSVCEAYLLDNYKIDNRNEIKGIAEDIGFKNNMISKVDYFAEQGSHIQLIELSDLREQLKTCGLKVKEAKASFDAINNDAELSKKDKFKKKEALIDDAWQSLRDEFLKKWGGSIAVIERLYRKTDQHADTDPQYSLLIVCKNVTDTKMLDELNTELGGVRGRLHGQCGMVKKVQVCKTAHIHEYLLS